jgi:hypothetical protein
MPKRHQQHPAKSITGHNYPEKNTEHTRTVHLNNDKYCSVCGETHGTDCHALYPLPKGFRDCFS